MKKAPSYYCRIIVIPHGKSERRLVDAIKSNLRLPMGFLRDTKSAVQVTSILTFLSKYRSHKALADAVIGGQPELLKNTMQNVRIFPILDLDDCTLEMAESYKSGQLFKDCIFKDYITPIYMQRNLDEVMIKAGYEIDVDKKTKSYSKAFPGNNGDKAAFENLCCNIAKLDSQCTNLNIFLEHCLSMINKQS